MNYLVALRGVICVGSILLTVCITVVASAFAQINTGEIGGVVRDSSGGVLPGASVTARHDATGIVVERVTDDEGRFFLPALRIGAWTVEARLTGLSPQTHKIVLEVGRTLTLEFSLSVQGLTERVEVQRTLPLLQVTTAEISDVIENREVVQLPLNGRNFLALAQLSDAVVLPPGGTRGEALQQAGPLPNVGGQRSGHNIYLLDGTKVTDELFNNLVINPSVDSIEEFKIQKSMYAAEFGGKASALINVVTRAGCQHVPRQRLRIPSRRRLRFTELLQAGWRGRASSQPEPIRRHARRSTAPQSIVLLRQLRRAADETLADANVFGAVRSRPRRQLRRTRNNLRSVDDCDDRHVRSLRQQPDSSRTHRSDCHGVTPARAGDNLLRNTQNLTAVEEQDRDLNQFSLRLDHELTGSDRLFARFQHVRRQTKRSRSAPAPSRRRWSRDSAAR